MRLDALARWLQDVAYADVEEAGVADRAVWVVRRTRLRVERWPRFGEPCTALTFCSGLGRMWAERRTAIAPARAGNAIAPAGAGGPVAPANAATSIVEAVSLWVHLDPASRRPTPLSDAELHRYREAAGERRVTARLRHPPPEPGTRNCAWTFRATECDLAGHINNAAYWQPLEEQLLIGPDPERIDAEIEFRTPAQPGTKIVALDGRRMWIVDDGGETHASIYFTLA
jgi:acyl-ACP thioesterase